MFKSTKKERDARIALFKGLDEKKVRALYEMSTILKFRQNDFLFKEGDVDQKLYIILSGKIGLEKSRNGSSQPIGSLREGDYVGQIDYLGKMPRTLSAVALEPTSVMIIDNETMGRLDEKTQVFFYRLLYDAALEKLKQLEEKEAKLTTRNHQLMKDIFYERTQSKTDFSNSEIIQSIIKKIPKLPTFASSVVAMLADERTSADALTEKIRNDPSLVGTILKAVNSSYYGFKQKISDIHRAIVMLGFNELYQLIVSEGIRQSMPKTPEFQAVHSHCVAISRIAAILSQETHIGKPAEMATIGLLHDIGQVVIQLLVQQNPKLATFIDGLDQTQLGSLLLKSWNLPEIVCGSVKFQYYPEFSPPRNIDPTLRDNVVLLYLSHLCFEYFQKEKSHRISRAFLEDYTQLVNLKDYSIEDICRVWILPGLKKNLEALPVSLKKLITPDE